MRLLAAITLCLLVLAGCAAQTPADGSGAAIASEAATTRPNNLQAELSLSQVAQRLAPPLESPSPATRPATRPALAAIELYARARGAMLEKDFYTAVNLLERAAELDPDSAAVQHALGRAYGQVSGWTDKALRATEKATQLNGDSLDAWLDLARLSARSGRADGAARALLYATKTSAYAKNVPEVVVVDFYLARALQLDGYERAAIELYEKLLKRSSRRAAQAVRGYPEVAANLLRSDSMTLELGKLYERRGQVDRAVALYDRVVDASPDALEPQVRVIRALASAGRFPQATRRATDVVRQFNASPASIELLLETYRAAGDEGRAITELRRLQRDNPQDQTLLRALADVLRRAGRENEAEELLVNALRRLPASGDRTGLLRRLVQAQQSRGDTLAAARTLIEETSRRPDTAAVEISPLWRTLVQSWRDNALRPDDLDELAGRIPAAAEPARLYWKSRIAQESGRTRLAEEALEQAAPSADNKVRTLFAPAVLLRMQQIWQAPLESTAAQDVADEPARRAAEADAYLSAVQAVAKDSDEALLAQLSAVDAYFRMKSPEDLPAFEQAIEASARTGTPPQIQLMYADALRRANQIDRFEQVMWKLLSDHPDFDDAYATLFQHYARNNAAGSAVKVLNTWISASPQSLRGKAMYASVMLDGRQFAVAEAMIDDLLTRYADEREVLELYLRISQAADRLQQGMTRLADMHQADPSNGAIVEALFAAHVNNGETPAALRLLDEAAERAEAGRHANLLYHIAQMYHAIGEREQCSAVLARTLALDPKHVPASNDQAYFWSEDGVNLSESERLARQAVSAEPDNPAYLDTLGWALYKQGRVEEALVHLHRAVELMPRPDPVLLDHLGDAMYRVGRAVQAADHWQRAMRIVSGADDTGETQALRPEHVELRRRVGQKLQQRLAGETVETAPIAGELSP